MSDERTPGSLREWVSQQADELDVDVDELLIQSRRRDPVWKGTDADHAKARWFADLWEKAVAGRDEDTIHVRGVHYYVVMSTGEETTLNVDALPVDFDPGELDRLDGPIEPPTNCSWSTYQNTDNCYDYLEEAAKLARILGYVPLDGIEDNKHDQFVVTHYGEHRVDADASDIPTPTGVDLPTIPKPDDRGEREFDDATVDDVADYLTDEIIDDLLDSLEFDRTSQEPYHVEIWCEKGLPDYIHSLARDLDVNVVVEGEGDLSLTIASDLVSRVEEAGKPAVILYFSDFDPKGDNMATAMAGKLAWLDARGDLTQRICIQQVAVTQDQVERFGLPRKPISESEHTGTGGRSYDTLVDEWEQRKGTGACELNTLEQIPELYEKIVSDAVSPFRDPGVTSKNRHALGEWQADVRDVVEEAVEDAGLPDHVDDLDDWLDEWNQTLATISDELEELHDATDDGYFDEWTSSIEEMLEEVDWPEVTVPEGEGELPDDPIFDTARSYPKNVSRVRQHKHGE